MKYYVTLPVCGSITVEVEAENESEADARLFAHRILKLCDEIEVKK